MSSIYTFETHEEARKKTRAYVEANMNTMQQLIPRVHGYGPYSIPDGIGRGLEFICTLELSSSKERGKERTYSFEKGIPGLYMESRSQEYKSIPELANAVKDWLKAGDINKVVRGANLKPEFYTVEKQLWQVLRGDEPEEKPEPQEGCVLEKVEPGNFQYPAGLTEAEREEFKKTFFTG